MPPIWDQAESEGEKIYKPVERHSPGMISFTYQAAASKEVLEALQDTASFKSVEDHLCGVKQNAEDGVA